METGSNQFNSDEIEGRKNAIDILTGNGGTVTKWDNMLSDLPKPFSAVEIKSEVEKLEEMYKLLISASVDEENTDYAMCELSRWKVNSMIAVNENDEIAEFDISNNDEDIELEE